MVFQNLAVGIAFLEQQNRGLLHLGFFLMCYTSCRKKREAGQKENEGEVEQSLVHEVASGCNMPCAALAYWNY